MSIETHSVNPFPDSNPSPVYKDELRTLVTISPQDTIEQGIDLQQGLVVEIIPEFDWTPATNIRLHHVRNWIPTGKLELFSIYLRPSSYRSMLRYQYLRDWDMYELDTVGNPGSAENVLHQEKTKAFLEMLEGFSDNTVVQLDSAPDGICAACPIGKHCSGTNYTYGGYHGAKMEKFDRKALRRIRKELIKKGFRQEADFKLIETETTMLDYEGQHLWTTPIENVTPITVLSDAILVKMGALRSIADIRFLNVH